MSQIIDLFLSLPPANVAGIALLERLAAGQPDTVEGVLAMSAEIEAAVKQLGGLIGRSKGVINVCLSLQPIPSRQVPAGF